MTIETKYNIGDEVWLMHHNKPTKVEVLEVRTTTKEVSQFCIKKYNETTITYSLKGIDFGKSEEELFPTKEELLKSL